jgi:hypothetical protein
MSCLLLLLCILYSYTSLDTENQLLYCSCSLPNSRLCHGFCSFHGICSVLFLRTLLNIFSKFFSFQDKSKASLPALRFSSLKFQGSLRRKMLEILLEVSLFQDQLEERYQVASLESAGRELRLLQCKE